MPGEGKSDGTVEQRPDDAGYYVRDRTSLFSQGDVFADVPLTFPGVGAFVAEHEGSRFFLSGPLEPGPAILITPTCQMSAQGAGEGYAHNVRTLVPIRTVDELVTAGAVKAASLQNVRSIDNLSNYMYLPALDGQYGESLALLYMPITIEHELLSNTATRVSQLAPEGARQLLRKLVLCCSNIPIPRRYFKPPMD
jgi:hypothetical protein